MWQYLDRFESEYQDYHGLSENRKRNQRRVLESLARLASKSDPAFCEAGDVRTYLAKEVADGRHPNTVAKKLKMIRPFFKWAFDAGVVNGDTLMAIQSVKAPNGSGDQTPKPYSLKELRQFRDQLDARWPLVEDMWWKRFERGQSRYKRVASEVMRRQIEAVVALALHCGLRQTEIFNLTLDDMHPDNAYVVVRQRAQVANGKDKVREVPYTDSAREAVRAWLTIRGNLRPPHDRPWIVAVCNVPEGDWLKPMSHDRFRELLRKCVGEGWRLHRFRHTSATAWLRAGVRIELVSRHLGHSRVTQTLGYAELVREDVQQAVEKNQRAFERLIGEEAPAA